MTVDDKFNYTWGKYQETTMDLRWLTGAGEGYEGHYGFYDPHKGYIQDFYPYDNTREDFRAMLKQMRADGYIKNGHTKMVDIDLSMLYPATSYYLSV
jgi:hypothetical protein